MGGDADDLVAQAADDRPGHGPLRAGHRVPEPQRRPSTARLGRPNRAAADRRAPADARTTRPRERIIRAHQPHRPDWLCTACRDPWPCQTYREHMIRDAPPLQLTILMTSWMTEATGELARSTPGELWDRFLTWTRQQPT